MNNNMSNNINNNIGEKFLPIGTVCLLENAKKRVMITGYAIKAKEKNDKYYDYSGCLYPEGVINSNRNLLFNHEQIKQVFFKGYQDAEYNSFMMQLHQLLNSIPELNASSSVNNVN